MREADIRWALLEELGRIHGADDSVIIEEMGLDLGRIRVDVAVVNGLLVGYEIKSDQDDLERLPAQRDAYNAIFDKVTVVAGARHLERLTELVPSWWGITIASHGGLDVHRPARQNEQRDAALIARLLWRDEAVHVLTNLGVVGISRAPRRDLWPRLVDRLSVDDLASEVRAAIKARRAAPRLS